MNTQTTKRRGPLLWMADLARQRPAHAALLALLLAVLGLISTGGTLFVWRVQRARVMEMRALEQLRLQRQLQQQAEPPPDAETSGPR